MGFPVRPLFGFLAIAFILIGVVGAVVLFGSRRRSDTRTTERRESEKVADESVPVGLPRNSDGSYRLQANSEGWLPIGRGNFTIEVKGSIDFGGVFASPDRSPIMGNDEALVPGVPFGVPVIKIGENGKPFMIGFSHRIDSGDQIAYIAINDSYYGDNKGSYIIYKR
jgi:hypothetical protein